MKKYLIILILLITSVVFAQEQPKHAWFNFDGQWLPDVEQSKIGAENFHVLQNMRYVDGGIEGVSGSTKINTTAIPINSIAQEIENGIHFKKDQPQESHVLIAGGKSGVTQIFKNDTTIPNQGDFSGTTLYSINTLAKQVRFSNAPGGNIVVTDGKESLIWGGDEMRVAAFITSESAVTNDTINPRDYTEQVNNKLSTSDEVAIIGGGNDSPWTKSLLHFDGEDGSTTFTESASGTTETRTWTVDTTATIDTDQKKFGTAAGYFDGGTSIWAADSVDWHMANGDGSGNTFFTIDFWVRISGYNVLNSAGLFHNEDSIAGDQAVCWIAGSGSQIQFDLDNGGVDVDVVNNLSTPLSMDVWYHVAIIRGWGGNVNDWVITVDGVAGTVTTDTDAWPDYDGALEIGRTNPLGVGFIYLNGWIDEFRWTKGKARWTSNFNPPSRPYSAEVNNWVIATTRPISGASFYLYDVNTQSGQTVTAQEWNGSSWTNLTFSGATVESSGTSEQTNGLSRSGKLSWSSTVNTSKPKFLEDRLFYWYQFALSDGDASIYSVTVDAPMQPIVDLWDGVYRQPISFQTVDSSGTSDYTIEVNEGSSDLYPIGAKMGGLTATDHTIMMFEDRIQAVRLEILGINTAASGVSVSYWSGSDWVVQASIYDETAQGSASLNKSGTISWQPPNREEEFKQTLYGVEGWAYRFVWNGTLDSAGDAEQTLIDVVYGIPAPIKVRPFKFSAQYKNRLLLCGYTEGNQGNRIDYSMTNAPDVWNGEETSMDGIQSLYVGGNDDLTAGVQIYNRYGSNIYTTFLMLKKTETYLLLGDGPSGEDAFKILPVSKNIGCPAPLTLATAEVSFETAEGQPTRNIAMWLSYSGPIVFDGAVLMPVAGINSYFDPVDDNYVGASAIENATGCYDATYREYNLIVSDYWFVYDLNKKRWFSKYSPVMPTVGFPVTDTKGSSYIYSGTTTGYLMRQEYGTTWDGSGIEQIVETGDFFPIQDPWFATKIDRIKVMTRRISESVNLDITHYSDGNEYSNTLMSMPLNSGSGDFTRMNISHPNGLPGWMHRLRFSTTTSSTTKGLRPLGWGFQRSIDYEDEQ